LVARFPSQQNRLELWKRCSWALHYARSECYIPGIRAMIGERPPRSENLDAPLTGKEPELPRLGFETPRRQYALVFTSAAPFLQRGYAYSYKIDLRKVLCDTPGQIIRGTSYRCVGTDGIRDRSTARLVLRTAVPREAHLTGIACRRTATSRRSYLRFWSWTSPDRRRTTS
jgi:hypothetical protein